MDTLTIDRGRWLTGTALDILERSSKLLHKPSGLMCCLGFYCRAMGYPPDSSSMPLGLFRSEKYPSDLEWLGKNLEEEDKVDGGCFTVDWELASTNDGDLPPAKREARIKKLFKKYGGITVKFVGRYREGTERARAVPPEKR